MVSKLQSSGYWKDLAESKNAEWINSVKMRKNISEKECQENIIHGNSFVGNSSFYKVEIKMFKLF